MPQLSGEITHQGGEDAATKAASLARPAYRSVDAHQPAALGPGLPAPPAVGGNCVDTDDGVGVPDPAGGLSCV